MDPADQFHADRLLFVVEKKVLGTAHVFQWSNSVEITCVVYSSVYDVSCYESLLSLCSCTMLQKLTLVILYFEKINVSSVSIANNFLM